MRCRVFLLLGSDRPAGPKPGEVTSHILSNAECHRIGMYRLIVYPEPGDIGKRVQHYVL